MRGRTSKIWFKGSLFWKSYPLVKEFIVAPLAISILFLLGYGNFLKGNRSIATFQDNTYLLNPLFSYISMGFKRGEYPYWINTLVGGLPLYNTPQFSLTYPFYFFHSGLYATALDAVMDIHYVTFFHIFILYLNTYTLLRVLRLAPLSSLLGASVFAFSSNTFHYSTWVNITASYSWFPLVIASVFLCLENRYVKAGVLLGTCSFGLLILASPSQSLIHAIYMIATVYVAYAVRCLINKNLRPVFPATVNLILMGVLTLLISAPAVVPAFLESKSAIRFLGEFPPLIGNAKMPFNSFLTGQLKPEQLAGTLIPLKLPHVLGNSFIGISSILLALFAIFKVRANWIVLPVLFISLYALLSAAGSNLGFAQINYHLPFLNKIREPPRHLFLFALGISILAAYGFSYLVESLSLGYRALLNWKTLAVCCVFLVLLTVSLRADLPYTGGIPKTFLVGTSGLTIGLLLTLPWLRGWQSKAVTTLVILIVVYSNLQYPRVVPKLQDGDYFSAANLNSHRTLEELTRFEDVRNYRIIIADDKVNSQFWSMNASYYGLRTFQAYMNPLPSSQFEEVFQRFYLRNYYPMLGAKYYLCNPCDTTAILDYELQANINGYDLYVAKQALPRYFLINHVAGFYVSQNDFYNKIHTGYDFAKEAYVDERNFTRAANWLGKQPSTPAYTFKEEHSSLNRLQLSINAPERNILVLNEYYNKNWKVIVNGIPVQPFPVNLNQIGVLLESQANLIEFEYRPTLFIWLLWVQYTLLAIMLLYVLYLFITAARSFMKVGRLNNSEQPRSMKGKEMIHNLRVS